MSFWQSQLETGLPGARQIGGVSPGPWSRLAIEPTEALTFVFIKV